MLEVLAAVLVLGLLYSVLADVAIEGLRAEGEASRRLQASLLADQLLGDLEAELVSGATPPFGAEEREQEPYRIEVAVVPLALPPEVIAAVTEAFPQSRLLAKDPEESGIRQIDIRVRWDEGDRELSVARTTFAFDSNQLAPPEEAASEEDTGPQGRTDLPQELIDFGKSIGFDVENPP
jgi:hypothetical protein